MKTMFKEKEGCIHRCSPDPSLVSFHDGEGCTEGVLPLTHALGHNDPLRVAIPLCPIRLMGRTEVHEGIEIKLCRNAVAIGEISSTLGSGRSG